MAPKEEEGRRRRRKEGRKEAISWRTSQKIEKVEKEWKDTTERERARSMVAFGRGRRSFSGNRGRGCGAFDQTTEIG